MAAYAGAGVVSAGHLRIAIVIADLGISARQTAAALAELPQAVTLAFAPYADDVQHWVTEARKAGHEVLIEVPMEPEGLHDADPGPHTLRSGLDDGDNAARLVWVLSRFTGYAGATNMEGGRFLADQGALRPTLVFMAKRGLLFFDDGEVTNSVAESVATQLRMAFVRSAVRIDSITGAREISESLSELETRARQHGSAAGAASLSPAILQSVTNWALSLKTRGFVLVPASEIVATTKAG